MPSSDVPLSGTGINAPYEHLKAIADSVLITAVVHGQRTVTTAGTEVQLSTAAIPLKSGIFIKALAANSGTIFVGGSNAVTSSNGYPLAAGESVFLAVDNVSDIWIDASANSQSVAYIGG